MPRDIHGKPVTPEQEDSPEKDKTNHPDESEDRKMMEPILQTQAEHHDRLTTIEKHLGIQRKPGDMKGQDQGGKKEKLEAGKVTERKRH